MSSTQQVNVLNSTGKYVLLSTGKYILYPTGKYVLHPTSETVLDPTSGSSIIFDVKQKVYLMFLPLQAKLIVEC